MSVFQIVDVKKQHTLFCVSLLSNTREQTKTTFCWIFKQFHGTLCQNPCICWCCSGHGVCFACFYFLGPLQRQWHWARSPMIHFEPSVLTQWVFLLALLYTFLAFLSALLYAGTLCKQPANLPCNTVNTLELVLDSVAVSLIVVHAFVLTSILADWAAAQHCQTTA